MEEFSFNLVDEPWIPCVRIDGQRQTVGLRDFFLQAHELRSIEHQNPLTEAALLRVLLAVLHRSIDGPKTGSEWKQLYQAGAFDKRISDYLKTWHHRFDLFSPDAPFYQTAGLQIVDGTGQTAPLPLYSLMMERASGNNKTLFDHTSSDFSIRLSPGEAAQVLITAQMYSLGGLNKKTTKPFGYQQSFLNGPMVSGVFIMLTGKNLCETLTLNALIYKDNLPIPKTGKDCPVWERDDIGATSSTTPKGYLDFLTCKCRHLCLVPKKEDSHLFVEHVHIAQGEAFPDVTNPGFYKKKKKDGIWYCPQLDPAKLVWRDSAALFSFDATSDQRPAVFRQIQAMKGLVDLSQRYICTAYALANDKANPLAWRKEKLNIPLALISEKSVVSSLSTAMNFAERGAAALDGATKVYMREYLPENSKDIAEKASATGVIRAYWDWLGEHFQRFLLDLEEPIPALENWESVLKKTARDALKRCVSSRYRQEAKSYKAWVAGSSYLNARLAKLSE